MKAGEFNQTIVKRLFRKHFNNKNPLKVPIENRNVLFEKLKLHIANLSNVTFNVGHHESYLRIHELKRQIYGYSLDYKFELIFDEQDKLTITYDAASTYVSDIEEIFNFITVCRNIMNDREIIRSKDSKVYDLKIQAISSQAKKIVGEEFVIKTTSRQFKLYVKIPEKNEYIELKIPRQQFNEIVPKLETILSSLITWREVGTKIKMMSVSNYYSKRNYSWKDHVG